MQEYRHDFESIFDKVEWHKHYPELKWKEVFDTIKNIPVTDDYKLEWKSINEIELMRLLVEEHGFGEERVKKKIDPLLKGKEKLAQKGLNSFFR